MKKRTLNECGLFCVEMIIFYVYCDVVIINFTCFFSPHSEATRKFLSGTSGSYISIE